MKIALTVKGAGLGAWLDEDFTHCGHVMIVDEDNRFEAWENPVKDKKSGLASLLADIIVREHADILITGKISTSNKDNLIKSGVKVMDDKSGTVLDLLEEARP